MANINNLILNRIFTKNTIQSFIGKNPDNCYYNFASRYVNDFKDKKNNQIISDIYRKLDNEYRNEYFYKNTLLNKLLFGVHSINTTTALTEIPINKSKADFILINGKAVVYEIKTELDTFERLNSQIKDYYKAFPNVVVVTSEDNLPSLEKILKNSKVGIYILKKNSISKLKEFSSNYSKLDYESIFKILRKYEYEYIIKKEFGKLPKVSDFDYFDECFKLFKKININKVYSMFIKQLKKRKQIDINLINSVPVELKSVVYFSNFKKNDYIKLNEFLDKKIGDSYVLPLS